MFKKRLPSVCTCLGVGVWFCTVLASTHARARSFRSDGGVRELIPRIEGHARRIENGKTNSVPVVNGLRDEQGDVTDCVWIAPVGDHHLWVETGDEREKRIVFKLSGGETAVADWRGGGTTLDVVARQTGSVPPDPSVRPSKGGWGILLFPALMLSVWVVGRRRRRNGSPCRRVVRCSRRMAYGTDRGSKAVNEDSVWAGVLTTTDGVEVDVVCVADGVSGGLNGTDVSKRSVETVKTAFSQASSECWRTAASLEEWASEWGLALQETVQEMYPGGYSTLCAVASIGNRWMVFNAGDSAAYWVPDADVGVRRLTEAHSGERELFKLGKSEQFAEQHAKELVRGVGIDYPEGGHLLDTELFPSRGTGWLVVATDGVFDGIGGTDLRLLSIKRPQASVFVTRILRLAIDRGRQQNQGRSYYQDNASVAVMRVKPGRRNLPRHVDL